MAGCKRAQNLRLARVGNVEDRGPVRPVLVANVSKLSADDDLSSTLDFHPAEMANIGRRARRLAGIALRSG